MATQAEADMVSEILERDWEGHTSNRVAREIIDAIRKSDRAKKDKEKAKADSLFKPVTLLPERGTAFKTPWSSVTYIVAWAGVELEGDHQMMWCVSSDSHLGWFGYTNSPLMKIYKDATASQSTIDKILVPTVDLKVGDSLLFRQDAVFSIEAMVNKAALLRHEKTGLLYTESTTDLLRFYKKRVGK
jgi:hypothetical protein